MLELYQAEGCHHSQDVREKLTQLGVTYVAHNPRLPGNAGGDVLNEFTHDELRKRGGEDQIPLLVDTQRGTALYDSEAIVEYLQKHYA